MKKFFISLCMILTTIACTLTAYAVYDSLQSKVPETYYIEAEVLSQDATSTTFCTNKGNFVMTDCWFDPDTEYLLNMASNGTNDIKDDEICAVFMVID